MKNVDSIIKISMYFLLCWYFIAPFIWLSDDTLSFGLKISYAMVNYSIIILLIRVISFEYKNPNFTEMAITLMLISWFFYSTYRDVTEPGYYFLLKMFYVSIDLLSTIFLIDTFVNLLLNSNIFLVNSLIIKNINTTMKIFLATIFSILYFQIYRHAK